MNQMNETLAASLPLLWMSARALGIVAWLAASATVIMGLGIRSRIFTDLFNGRTTTLVHRTLSMTTLLLVIAHVVTLLPDPYAHLRWYDMFIPGLASHSRVPTALGSLAFLLLIAVGAAALFRSRLSARSWSIVHVLAYAVWPLATAHYVLMGTDVMRSWSLIVLFSVTALVVLTVMRRGQLAPRRIPQAIRRTPAEKVSSR